MTKKIYQCKAPPHGAHNTADDCLLTLEYSHMRSCSIPSPQALAFPVQTKIGVSNDPRLHANPGEKTSVY